MPSELLEDQQRMTISSTDGVVEIGQTIGGREYAIEEAIDVRNPGDLNELVGRVSDGTAKDAEHAVAAAKNATEEWALTSVPTRIAMFSAIAAAIDERAEWLASIAARENGSVRHIIQSELSGCAPAFRAVEHYLADKLEPQQFPA